MLASAEMEGVGVEEGDGPDLSGSWPTTSTLAVLQDEGLVPKGEIAPASISTTRLASERVGKFMWNQVYMVQIKLRSGESVQAIARVDYSTVPDMNMGPIVYVVSKVLHPDGKPEPAKR